MDQVIINLIPYRLLYCNNIITHVHRARKKNYQYRHTFGTDCIQDDPAWKNLRYSAVIGVSDHERIFGLQRPKRKRVEHDIYHKTLLNRKTFFYSDGGNLSTHRRRCSITGTYLSELWILPLRRVTNIVQRVYWMSFKLNVLVWLFRIGHWINSIVCGY